MGGARARGRRGRGRGRGKKKETLDGCVAGEQDVVNLVIETSEDAVMQEVNKENSDGGAGESVSPINTEISTTATPVEEPLQPVVLPQTIDMEADISQLEAPTFTTISRGPPEPMLRLKWDHKVNLIGEKVLNPMIHCCDQCDKPILLYGRMIPCKHVFCLKCARAEPVKVCPRCSDKVVRVEQSGLGTVFMCTHGGSRYGNTGCRRTYLSQRDLQAHINHRHVTQPPPPLPTAITAMTAASDIKQDITIETLKGAQRKLSESSSATSTIQTPSLLHSQRPQMRASGIGSILPPGVNSSTAPAQTHSTLTQANLARINTANAQDCHQGKVALHQTLKKTPITQAHHQPPETVADASYYSSVLNSFGSAANGPGPNVGGGASGGPPIVPSNTNAGAAVGYSFDGDVTAAVAGGQTNSSSAQGAWPQSQYYR